MTSVNFEVSNNSPLGRKIRTEVIARQKHSERKLSKRYQAWRDADERQQLYITEREIDSINKNAKRTSGNLDYVQVEVPYSFGMMMAQHTYLTSVFLGRSPIQQYTSRHGEPETNLLAIEALMDYQIQVGKATLPYYIWFFDACKYGVGIVGTYWLEEEHTISSIIEVPKLFLGAPTGDVEKVRRTEKIAGYHGNKVYNVRPDKFFLDPRVTYANIQAGEYCGREAEIGWSEVVQAEARGQYFNIKELRENQRRNDQTGTRNLSSRIDYPEQSDNLYSGEEKLDRGFVKIWEFYIKVVPRDWELGKGELPEVWVFTIANESVLIECRPLGELSNEFPFDTLEQEIEGYALHKRGTMEQMESLNQIITWLFNSHFFNVRASLNDQFVYDPTAVSMKDVLDASPGKRIRIKPGAQGRDIRTFFQQVPVQDVTRSHITDQNMVGEMMQRMSGIVDNIMGLVNDGGRKTATEVRTASSFGINRLKTVAEYMSAMGFAPHSQRMLQSTQQNYDLERQFKIVGDLPKNGSFVNVTPDQIAGFYDFVAVDGTLPVDRFAQANLWKEILIGVQQMPEIAQQYDLAGIFSWMAQLSGLRNIQQFRINMQPEIQPGQSTANDGNVIPLSKARSNLNEPKQIPNLGPTG